MNWEEYVKHFSQVENPDYGSISFQFPDIERKQPSFFTRLNSHLLSEFIFMEQNKAIIIYPTSGDFVLSVVFFKIIEGILSGDSTTDPSAVELQPGDKFRIGDAIALCRSRYVAGNGVTFISFGPTKGSNCTSIPASTFPRVEKVPAETATSSYKKIDDEFHRIFKFKDGSYHVEAQTLSDKIKQGKILTNGTVLIVSRDEKFSSAIEDFTIEGKKVTELISIHKAKFDGTLIPIGKSAFTPQIIIAPTIPAAYTAANSGNKIVGIYIDTGSIRSFAEYESDLLGLTDEIDVPLYFFIPESSSLDYSLLLDRGFEVFRWIPGMVGEFIISMSDESCHPFLNVVSKHTILPYCVANPTLSNAFATLKAIEDECEGNQQQVTDSIALLFKYVFLLARLCSPLTEAELSALIERGDKTIGDMMDPKVFSFNKNQQLAKKLEATWEIVKKELAAMYPLKEVALVCDLLAKEDFANKRVFLVVPNDLNKAGVTESLESLLNQIDNKPVLSIFTLEEFYENSELGDYVFICGWLGKEKMKRIIFSNAAPNFVPVLYDFELPWLRASINRWNNENSKSNISFFIPDIEEPEESELSLDYSWFEEPLKPSDGEDFDELVQKTQKLQWHGYSEFQKDDTEAEGRLISFSDGSFGVFSQGYSITRIPTQEDQSVSSVSVSELFIGDIVIFGESDHDLLVSESNKLLCSEGHEDSLAMAMSWRDAIRLAKNSGLSEEEIIKSFKKEGIVRTDTTFREWLDDESAVICPRNKEDLIKISTALGDDILCDSAEEIILASKIVRAARVQTGKLLMKRLRENLDVADAIKRLRTSNEFSHQSFVVDVAGIGKVEILSVVEVGQIATYPQRIINQRKVY